MAWPAYLTPIVSVTINMNPLIKLFLLAARHQLMRHAMSAALRYVCCSHVIPYYAHMQLQSTARIHGTVEYASALCRRAQPRQECDNPPLTPLLSQHTVH